MTRVGKRYRTRVLQHLQDTGSGGFRRAFRMDDDKWLALPSQHTCGIHYNRVSVRNWSLAREDTA
jgi:hypothetical protein